VNPIRIEILRTVHAGGAQRRNPPLVENGFDARGIDGRTGETNAESLENVQELAYVPGPLVRPQPIERAGRESRRGEIELVRQAFQTFAHESGDVVDADPQRRNPDADDVQAEVEVGAKRSGGDRPRKIAGCCGDHPRGQRDRSAAADAFELAVLECAQQLALLELAELADFVEEEGSARGAFEAADALCDGAGKAPAFVPEELAVGQVGRQCRAVDVDERAGATGGRVQHPSGDALAGARLAPEEHRRSQRRHRFDLRAEREHRLARVAPARRPLRFAGDLHRVLPSLP